MLPDDNLALHTKTAAELSVGEFHDLLRLRVDVFVVEQECPYHELDGLDIDPSTRHVWTCDNTGVTSCLRILADPMGWRIGRVATRIDARGAGLSRRLMNHALHLVGDATVVLEAQSYLMGFYGSFGFKANGAEYVEDGIPHVPMMRANPATTESGTS